ncbi:hypothetical protein BK133_13865 [Paenibacillus sp. FSL H8-0548]|uniref:S-layer homology domain-containing protein n=1 Tax=Paenibacillus sp. FSL H8-0548 TaxID=1920422 RepID=UPI00096BDE22|nr:S-layer homology domain-containing protein [Paenibacillus sp. FSL H8-0548]OMF32591.1 hypothetical protein BK133_13865 [Paenibacillus sp. FSL H8-0548]
MKLRRKIAISTIAASVALTALAGIPLSSKGLVEKLGVSGVVYAASTGSNAAFLTESGKIYTELAKISGGVEAVEAFRVEIAAALAITGNSILVPITERLDVDDQAGFKEVIVDLLAVPVSSGWEASLDQKRELHKEYLKGLSQAAGVTLTVDDIAQVALALETKLATIAGSVTGLADINASLKDQLRAAVKSALESNTNVKAVIEHYQITTEDLTNVYTELQASPAVNALTALSAFVALDKAYKAAHPATGGIGGGDVIPVPETPVPESTGKLLDDLTNALDKATESEKAAIITKFVADAQAEIAKLATISASSSVSTVNGQAVLQLNDSDVLSVIAGINAVAAKVNEVAPTAAIAKTTLAINLGDVTAKDVVVNLSDAVVKAAAAGNVSGAAFTIGEFKVTLPVGGTFNSALSLTIKKSEATEEAVGALKSASEIYDFGLTVGGTARTTFDQPITLNIPLGDTTGIDKELLSVAKIVDGELVFHGGRVSGNSIIESRDSFSSYVVVENKVSFSDIASVEAWAGRQIQVVAAKGAIEGKSEGKFVPKDKVTRAEFAKMLIRALDLENGSAAESFDDVNSTDWYAPYVAAAAQLKIINGRSASKFDPNATITRAEMATMISRALKVSHDAAAVTDVDTALKGFADAARINATLKEGVAFAATHKIVIGDAGKFLPNNNATRAEAAVIIYRALNFNN